MDIDDAGDNDEQRMQIRAEVSNLSFEELQKLKEKLGAKVYNEAVFGTTSKKHQKRKVSSTNFKRENKNRPREMSSRKPVPLLQDTSKVPEKTVRDPRFDSLCGDYNPKAFKRSYSFLTEVRERELKMLKRELKSTLNVERQEQIKYLIQRMENQNREEELNKKKEEKKQNEYMERVQLMKEGKNPNFVKKSEKKVIDLVEQYEDLKKTGKLEKHISKHRKRNTQKVKKNMSFM